MVVLIVVRFSTGSATRSVRSVIRFVKVFTTTQRKCRIIVRATVLMVTTVRRGRTLWPSRGRMHVIVVTVP